MSQKPEFVPITSSVSFYALQDDKFKSNRISIHFVLPLREETVSAYALVPMILSKGYRECPDFLSLSRKLESLYGGWIDAAIKKYGDLQILTLSAGGMDNTFALTGEDITGELCDMLCNAVFDPVLDENGYFPETTFRLEQQNLLDAIASMINDKRFYSVHRTVQEMYRGNAVGLNEYGTEEAVRALTPEKVTEAYRRMLAEAKVMIQFCGCGAPAPVREKMAARFADFRQAGSVAAAPLPDIDGREAQRITERLEVAQSKLVLGLRITPDYREKHTALRLMTMILGGTPSSLLFKQVREKQSLCYYCAARYYPSLGMITIDSGVEHEKAARAEAAILEQLSNMQKGRFTDREFEEARLAAINSYRTLGDTLSSIDEYYWGRIMEGEIRTPEDMIALLSGVTRDDVIEAANQVTVDTVFLLTGQEGSK